MISHIEDFKTGWYGISIALTDNDIDRLIGYLKTLKDDQSYHFHLYTTQADKEETGVADIEFSRQSESAEESNMDIGA